MAYWSLPSGSLLEPEDLIKLNTPDGKHVFVKAGNAGDIYIVLEVLFERTYRDLHVSPGDRVLDVGAHIGTFAISVGDRAGEVVCVEQDPDSFAVLRVNVESSLGRRAVCFLRTVSNSTSVAGQISIDDLARETHVSFDIMKIDIDGGEARALEGAAETLKGLRELIVEVEGSSGVREVTDRLTSIGFEVRIVEGMGTRRFLRSRTAYKLARLVTMLRLLVELNIRNPSAVGRLLPMEMSLFYEHFDTTGGKKGADMGLDTYLVHATKRLPVPEAFERDRTTLGGHVI